jgi:hypothetical protein
MQPARTRRSSADDRCACASAPRAPRSCPPTTAEPSMGACARSTSSAPRSRSSNGHRRTRAALTRSKRLMTVPGVSLMTATTFIAALGDVRRFHEPRKLVSYLGLDRKVRQSGIGAARHGRISKQGASQVRRMLAEAAFVAVSTARRCARSMSASAHAVATRSRSSPSRASSPCCSGTSSRASRTTRSSALPDAQGTRGLERELSEQAEIAYRRLVTDWTATTPTKSAATT